MRLKSREDVEILTREIYLGILDYETSSEGSVGVDFRLLVAEGLEYELED